MQFCFKYEVSEQTVIGGNYDITKTVSIAVGLMLACGTAFPNQPRLHVAPGRPKRIGVSGPGENGPTAWYGPRTRIPKRHTIAQQADLAYPPMSSSRIRPDALGREVVADPRLRTAVMSDGARHKSKCMFWADDRAWGWFTRAGQGPIDGQEPRCCPGLGVQCRAAPV